MSIMEPIMEPVDKPRMKLSILPERLAVCRLERNAPIPEWVYNDVFCSVTRTPHELSVVCPEKNVPADVECDKGWRAMSSEGPLGFSLTGLVECLAEPLAVAGISIFVISTYHTDFFMVKEHELEIALLALRKEGHSVIE